MNRIPNSAKLTNWVLTISIVILCVPLVWSWFQATHGQITILDIFKLATIVGAGLILGLLKYRPKPK